jgi:hypothetical protein
MEDTTTSGFKAFLLIRKKRNLYPRLFPTKEEMIAAAKDWGSVFTSKVRRGRDR